MNYTNPLLNALIAAVLGILLVAWVSWGNPFEHRYWMLFVAVSCAILGITSVSHSSSCSYERGSSSAKSWPKLVPRRHLRGAVRPNPSLKAPTRYGSHRLATSGQVGYRPSVASRRLPPRSA